MGEWHCFAEAYESLYHEVINPAADAAEAGAAASNRTNVEGPWYAIEGKLYVVEIGTEKRYRAVKTKEWEPHG